MYRSDTRNTGQGLLRDHGYIKVEIRTAITQDSLSLTYGCAYKPTDYFQAI